MDSIDSLSRQVQECYPKDRDDGGDQCILNAELQRFLEEQLGGNENATHYDFVDDTEFHGPDISPRVINIENDLRQGAITCNNPFAQAFYLATTQHNDQFNVKRSADEVNTPDTAQVTQMLSELDDHRKQTEAIHSCVVDNFSQSESSGEYKICSPASAGSASPRRYSTTSRSNIVQQGLRTTNRQDANASRSYQMDLQIGGDFTLKRPLQNLSQNSSKRGRRATLSSLSRSSDEDLNRKRSVAPNGSACRGEDVCNPEELRRLQIRESNREAARRCRERRRRHIERLEDLVQSYETKIAKLQADNNELHKEVSRLKGYILQNMECFPATIIWKRLNGDMLYPLGLSSPLNVFQGENYNNPVHSTNSESDKSNQEHKFGCSCNGDGSGRPQNKSGSSLPLNLSNHRSTLTRQKTTECRSGQSDKSSDCEECDKRRCCNCKCQAGEGSSDFAASKQTSTRSKH